MSDNFMRIRKGLIVNPTTSIPTSSVDGAILFDDNEKKFKRWNSNANAWVPLGEGTGELNFLELSNKAHDAEAGTTGWSTYKDAAQARPVDGTGGTATVVSAISTTSTDPLSGTKSFLFAKGSGNAQGEGWSVDFQIDRARQASVVQIEFDYRLDSGTFVAGSSVDYTTSGDSDLIVYIYDVDNGVMIEPTTFRLYSNSTGITDKFVGNFQTSHNGVNYRLIFHVATTNTAAWTLKIDNIKVQPAKYAYGTPITDWVDFPSVAAGTLITATTTNPTYGNVNYNRAQWRRVGSEMEIRWIFRQTTGGTAGSGAYLFNLPPGYQIDFSKLDVNMPNTGIGTSVNSRPLPNSVFHGTFESGSNSYVLIGHVSPHSSTQLKVVGQDALLNTSTHSNSRYWDSIFWQFSLSNLNFSLFASVPIAGWSSSVKVAEPMETRDVFARAIKTADQTFTTSFSKVTFNSVLDDTTSSFNLTNNEFRVPVSGLYNISFKAGLGGAYNAYYAIFVNGSHVEGIYSYQDGLITTTIQARAGDLIDVRARSTSGNITIIGTLTDARPVLTIFRLPSSQTLAQGEAVYVHAQKTDGQTIVNNPGTPASTTQLTNWTKLYDTHNALDATNGIFTAPVSGLYEFAINMGYAPTFSGELAFQLINSANTTLLRSAGNHTTTASRGVAVQVCAIFLRSGEQVRLKAAVYGAGSNQALSTNSFENIITIKRIG